MRRATQARLEAALAQLASVDASAAEDASNTAGRGGLDELLDSLETAAEVASNRLRESEMRVSRLTAALDLVEEGVVICDEHGTELYRNNQAVRHLSGRLGEVLAEQAIHQMLEQAGRGEYPDQLLERFAPTRRNLSIRAFPLDGADGSLGAAAVIEDVSERRRIDAMRRDFVANVSHELKTPVGALSLLAETLDGEEDADTVARLSVRVGMEAERLCQLIDDLLDLSRIEADEVEVHESVPLDVLIGQAVDPLRAVAEGRDIKLKVVQGEPVAINGARIDLVSAIKNLVDNAIKYSEGGSLVEVRTCVDGNWVDVEVSDQGIGIPSRDLERVFERFYRVDRARSRSTGGTGLGLSIVRHVAANHGGQVYVTSTEGDGSTFTLRLPRDADATSGP